MWFDGRAKALGAVVGPTRVRLVGEILPGANFRSPFSEVPALLFGWSFLLRNLSADSGDAYHPTFARIHELIWAREPLRLQVGDAAVVVPIADPKVSFRYDRPQAEPIARDWPAYLPPVPVTKQKGQPLWFDERTLIAGDRVELVATVEPALVAAGGAYRGGGSTDPFVVRPDLERVSLVEV